MSTFRVLLEEFRRIRRFDRRNCSISSIYRRWHCAEELFKIYSRIEVEEELWTLRIAGCL